ncbi:hypothetical protein SRABI27_01153 [Pedobacter sp. Bi27]|nr:MULTISPECIES: hypothetical protein [unclassified Pedobacter]CAH0176847.1 hypothetical protein SRABI27_01153 [Pedobacter sp. Bi27]CAH0296302.1 hypothetical protein SRABI36_04478 [Pedobacter sp. Bi36]CAH0307044.1 hypothetical protein SRABI126_04599 [Pedobacter sp. Bi126]
MAKKNLPDNLKNGIESLSGISMDGVAVHLNSDTCTIKRFVLCEWY